MRSENPEPDATTLLIVRGDWFLMVSTDAREQPTAVKANIAMVMRDRGSISFMPNVRAHRPPLDPGAGSKSRVQGTEVPEFETGNGGSDGAILFDLMVNESITVNPF